MTIETIAAIATPPGRGGIGVVRISGPAAKTIALKLTKRSALTPRHAQVAYFYGEDQSVIDEGLLLFFPGPHSFTGEDVIELQGHGGVVILDMLLSEVLARDARLARPGEFSERAFLNGKMDLTQAEAIADLIDAHSQTAAKLAVRSLQGEFSTLITTLQHALTELRMFVEAAIDFPDEDIDFITDNKIVNKLERLLAQVSEVLEQAKQGAIIREGLNIVIIGKPNVGKSSLLNKLSGREAAIVTAVAGTTRDTLHEYISLDGLPLHIIDTAGIRETSDIVEKEGVRRAKAVITTADLLLLVVDATVAKDDELAHSQTEVLANLATSLPVLIVKNKIDLTQEQPQHLDTSNSQIVKLSVKTGAGINLLKTTLQRFAGYQQHSEGVVLARRRHLDALTRAKQALQTGISQLTHHQAGELLAEDLRQAQRALGEITGEFTSDDLLGEIFGRFCIGK